MIAYLYHSIRFQIACWRVRYWSQVCSGQRRAYGWAHDDDRLRNALIDRSDALRKREQVRA